MTRMPCGVVFLLLSVSQGSIGQPDSLVFYQDVSWSPDGARLLVSRMTIGKNSYPSSIMSINADGSDPQFLTSGPADKWTTWSPDGSTIAYSSTVDGNTDIYAMKSNDGSVVRLTTDPGEDTHPDWSPDGTSIAFAAKRGDAWQIFVMRADGSELKQLTNGPGGKWNPRWSPDGIRLAFYGASEPGKDSIFVMRKDGSRLSELGPGVWPSWAPDTTQLLYVEANNAYRMNIDGTDRRFMVAKTIFARWSPDGERIAFIQETWRAPRGWPASTALFVINADGSGRRKITDQ